ncbi:very short patch repair endonuclease [Methanolobus sp. WCC4]|uniref:very short patch repair endonuclease n=1 Tax=Methanolobus sp. WCC4 TaxID=3125784 RepID=UPI0030F525A6
MYIRDGRAPIPESETTSRVMSANTGKNTKPEIIFRKALREVGIPGYRLHWKKVPGRPDIAYPGKKIAIFVHGCYWHRCPHCDLPLPRSNTDFWAEKFRKNKERDAKKKAALEAEGWDVMVFWECQIKKDAIACAESAKELFDSKSKK